MVLVAKPKGGTDEIEKSIKIESGPRGTGGQRGRPFGYLDNMFFSFILVLRLVLVVGGALGIMGLDGGSGSWGCFRGWVILRRLGVGSGVGRRFGVPSGLRRQTPGRAQRNGHAQSGTSAEPPDRYPGMCDSGVGSCFSGWFPVPAFGVGSVLRLALRLQIPSWCRRKRTAHPSEPTPKPNAAHIRRGRANLRK